MYTSKKTTTNWYSVSCKESQYMAKCTVWTMTTWRALSSLCFYLYICPCCGYVTYLCVWLEMTSCHRPRIYRSTYGCCICGAKSSSSRFTASTRYESYFERCFALSSDEQRTGDICNACVLLVKRFRKLPSGSTRCWAHVCIVSIYYDY